MIDRDASFFGVNLGGAERLCSPVGCANPFALTVVEYSCIRTGRLRVHMPLENTGTCSNEVGLGRGRWQSQGRQQLQMHQHCSCTGYRWVQLYSKCQSVLTVVLLYKVTSGPLYAKHPFSRVERSCRGCDAG